MPGSWGSLLTLRRVSPANNATNTLICMMIVLFRYSRRTMEIHCWRHHNDPWFADIWCARGFTLFQITTTKYSRYRHIIHVHAKFLLTSSTRMHHWMSGFGQGIRRSVFSTAAILGPLWAGGTVSFSYYILLGVPCGLLVFVTVCMYVCIAVPIHFQ